MIGTGLMWKNQGHLPNAIQHFEKALSLDHGNKKAARFLAISYSDLGSAVRCEGRKEDGKTFYHKSLAADYTYPAAW